MNMIRNGYVGKTVIKGHFLANSKRISPKIRLKYLKKINNINVKYPFTPLKSEIGFS